MEAVQNSSLELGQEAERTGTFSAMTCSTITRTAHLFFGIAMIIACVGLTVMPMPWMGAGPFLVRMLIAMGLLVGGMMLMQSGTDNSLKELRFDGLQGMLYVVRRRPRRRGRVLASHSYDDIGEVAISDSELAVLDRHGRVLVSVPLDGPQARLDAVAQMRTHLPFLI